MTRRRKRSAAIGWWLIAVTACCVRLLQSPESDVFLIEPATVYADPSESEATWDIPLIRLNAFEEGLIVPEWFAVALAAALVVSMLNRSSNKERIGSIILIILLAAAWTPDHLLTWFWLVLSARILPFQTESPWTWKTTLLATASIVGALLTTLDFAVVILLTLTAAIDSTLQQRKATNAESSTNQLVCICFTSGVCLVAAFSLNGFGETLLRPLTAISTAGTDTPYSILQRVSHSLLDSLVLAGIVLVVLNRLQNFRDTDKPAVITMVVFLALGLLCRAYLPIAAAALVLVSASKREKRPAAEPLRRKHFLTGLSVAAVIGILVAQMLPLQSLLSSDPLKQRLVDLSSLKSEITVLLTNPKTTPRWKASIAPPNARLIVDNRWERFTTTELETTQQAFADLLRGRREKYLLANTKGGGTRDWMGDQNPDLLVVESDQWTAIRQLSLDPGWNVIAIDGLRTVFAAAGHPELDIRAQEANRLWFFLEWPNPRSRVQVEGILEPGLEADSIRVAGVLNAMRLPYAALRVLPDVDSVESDVQRAWSYTELAIRCARQNGHTSILDVIRARLLLNRLQSRNTPLQSHRQHVARMQEALNQAIALIPNRATNDQEIGAQSAQTRQSILLGHFEKVSDRKDSDPADERTQMMISILQGLQQNDSAWVETIQKRTNLFDLKADLRQEISFYLGCLSLENRDISTAERHFQQAMLIASDENLEAPTSITLCRLYLQQLTQ